MDDGARAGVQAAKRLYRTVASNDCYRYRTARRVTLSNTSDEMPSLRYTVQCATCLLRLESCGLTCDVSCGRSIEFSTTSVHEVLRQVLPDADRVYCNASCKNNAKRSARPSWPGPPLPSAVCPVAHRGDSVPVKARPLALRTARSGTVGVADLRLHTLQYTQYIIFNCPES